MKQIHRVNVEAFTYPTEDQEKVQKAIQTFTAQKPKQQQLDSYYGPSITWNTATDTRQKDIKQTLQNLKTLTSQEDMQTIQETLPARTDKEGKLYIRYSKQHAYQGELKLQYSGDIIQVKIRIAAHPATRANILKTAEQVLQ